jgi:hypothetical protein
MTRAISPEKHIAEKRSQGDALFRLVVFIHDLLDPDIKKGA